MKKFLTTGMLTIIVLTGTVFPVGIATVQAGSIQSIFNTETVSGQNNSNFVKLKDFKLVVDPGYTISTKTAKLNLSFNTKSGELPKEQSAAQLLLNPSINLNDPNLEYRYVKGLFDATDGLGIWDEILNGASTFGDSRDKIDQEEGSGVYFRLYKLQDKTKSRNEPGNQVAVTNYTIPFPSNVHPYYLRRDGVSSPAQGKLFKNGSRTNLGIYIWGGGLDANGENPFFKKQSFSFAIPITGLEPDTKYVAQISVSEDSSTGEAFSDVVEFQTPATDTQPPVDPTGSTDETVTAQDDENAAIQEALDCSLMTDGFGYCMGTFVYGGLSTVGSWLLRVSAKIFNAFLVISIGSSIYDTNKAQFVYQGWRICRDIANIFFIFVLLYTAIGTILGLHSVNYKKVVTQVILVAIFINFSMFMCRVIIDTGNILARVFYNEITLTGSATTYVGTTNGELKEKDLAGGLVNGVNPQSILLNQKEKGVAKGFFWWMFVGLMVFIIDVALAWTLFMSAAFFAGRIGVLWVSMIFAPLAFVSTLIPSLGKQFGKIGWGSWIASLTKAAFNAPIFMFFIYIILLLTQAGLNSVVAITDAADGTIEVFVVAILPLVIILGLLSQAKDIAKDMAGQFGEMADSAFKGVMGLGAMAVTGGVAALGAKTFGANAMRTLNDQNLKNVAAGNMEGARAHGFTGTTSEEFERWKSSQAGADFKKKSEDAQKKLLSAKKMSERSFDMRQAPGMSAVSKALGVNMNTGSGLAKMAGLEFSSGARAGGARAEADRRIAKDDQKKKDMEEVLKGDPAEIHHKKEQKEGLESEKKKAEEAKTEVEERNKPLVEAAEKAEKDANFAVQQEKDRTGRVSQATLDRQKTAKDAADNARSVQTAELKPFNEKIKAIEKGGTYTENGQTFTVNFKDSIKGLDKDINYAEKGRAREYFKNKADDAHHARDTYGNALSMNSLGATLKGALRDGLIGFAVGGPLGALAGSVVGASRENGAVLNRLIGVFENTNRTLLGLGHTNFSGRAQSYEEDQLKSDPHYHAKNFKDSYKSPSKDFFKIFEGLGGGGGHGGGDHGGGHDDHGHGGHDDHGGGDHGGGHH